MIEFSTSWPEYNPKNPTHELIVAYLTIDIQHSQQWVNELLQKIKAVQTKQLVSWERTGNAYCLRLNSEYAEIEEDFEEASTEPVKIPLQEFDNAVSAWQKHIASYAS